MERENRVRELTSPVGLVFNQINHNDVLPNSRVTSNRESRAAIKPGTTVSRLEPEPFL